MLLTLGVDCWRSGAVFEHELDAAVVVHDDVVDEEVPGVVAVTQAGMFGSVGEDLLDVLTKLLGLADVFSELVIAFSVVVVFVFETDEVFFVGVLVLSLGGVDSDELVQPGQGCVSCEGLVRLGGLKAGGVAGFGDHQSKHLAAGASIVIACVKASRMLSSARWGVVQPVVNVFCRRASPLYFSLVKMERTVVVDQVVFPRGVTTPSAVSAWAIVFGDLPLRYSAYTRRTIGACSSSSITSPPSAPLL